MNTLEDLGRILDRLDGRGYKAYKDLKGVYDGGHFRLFIDSIQGDPFAAPSTIRVRVSHEVAGIPAPLWQNAVRRLACRDFLARMVRQAIHHIAKGRRGIGKSGLIRNDAGGQEVLDRTAVVYSREWIEGRLEIGLPASGRTILGGQAKTMFCRELPAIVEHAFTWARVPQEDCRRFVECVENYEAIQRQLPDLGLVAFLADGAILPRESGVSQRPLESAKAQPVVSPDSLRVTVRVPNPVAFQGGDVGTTLTGMGIPQGVTLVVGGGYHGKSTLLQALQRGVYPHVPGDGREYVVTVPSGVKVRAEEGRSVTRVNISGFLTHLPFDQTTTEFSTDNASGSTSQAASIMEALEVGAKALFVDEDTSATNFLIRDARMQALVGKADEPITPLLDRVRDLYHQRDVSTVMVMGGCGDYFDVADTVIMMREFEPYDVTQDAKRVAARYPTQRRAEATCSFPTFLRRVPLGIGLYTTRGIKTIQILVRSLREFVYGGERIDLSGIEQLVDSSQIRAAGYALHLAAMRLMDGKATIKDVVLAVDGLVERHGMDYLASQGRCNRYPGNLVRPRVYELAAILNRLRSLEIQETNCRLVSPGLCDHAQKHEHES